MGEKGLPSRLLAARSGAYLTFGALSPAQASAPGQPTVAQLRSLYRLSSQSAATKARPLA
jgi:3-dehydroquinate dehydratase/shikimate dehydrogenase